jgi:flagellin
MSVINTNVKSLVAQNALTVNNRSLSKAMEQLSTGSRINSAADDAAGLAISNKMTAQIRGMNQAVRNANDGISMIQTAEGATKEISNMLQRMREVTVQAANDTYSADDRLSLEKEYVQLYNEIDRIAGNTQWNGMKLFTEEDAADGGVGAEGLATLQVGANANVASGPEFTIDVQFKKLDAESMGLATVGAGDAATAPILFENNTTSQAVLVEVDASLKYVDAFRADLGSKINRLTYAADNLTNISQNTTASRSQIMDTDYAATTTELARTQIIQQAATAMLAQANQAPQSVMSLLR